ncbi:MAG: Gfo/Idh/MocA family oxidoreductase [Candidatus Hydrogenedentes bacterium]|nr:Gfo/Idh/MocA family oxidoreductase [Candidatus Hydrogenedentota bacterium]
MAKKIRVGFIGAGGISHGHYIRLLETKKAEVVALNEPNPEMVKRFHARFPDSVKLPVFDDYRDMLKNNALDAVVVQSPHTVHYEQILTCLNQGLHVLAEKPMTCTIKHAKALIQKAKAAKRVLMISYQRHFEPSFRYMRERIAKGALGEVQYVQAIQSQEWLRATRGTWRQRLALSGGGQLNDSGSHLVDIVMWVTGMKVKEVFAKQDNFGTEVDINSTLAMKFENGALGSMSVIGNAPRWYEDHSIVGSKGALYLRQGIGLIHQDEKGQPVNIKLPKYTKNPDSNFVECILGKDVPQTPPECGLRTIEVTEAAWKSAASGKPVRVP